MPTRECMQPAPQRGRSLGGRRVRARRGRDCMREPRRRARRGVARRRKTPLHSPPAPAPPRPHALPSDRHACYAWLAGGEGGGERGAWACGKPRRAQRDRFFGECGAAAERGLGSRHSARGLPWGAVARVRSPCECGGEGGGAVGAAARGAVMKKRRGEWRKRRRRRNKKRGHWPSLRDSAGRPAGTGGGGLGLLHLQRAVVGRVFGQGWESRGKARRVHTPTAARPIAHTHEDASLSVSAARAPPPTHRAAPPPPRVCFPVCLCTHTHTQRGAQCDSLSSSQRWSRMPH